ncbi:protein OSB1, mitochondrial-like [Mercurialis annua]|uniref:protein OSB1, mitochondrial-like n=1 Tax=Mercurialis annua TaxID=3986 RepID=UPI00215E20F9|nr:protein OSB1, mitochondrial-like [Mercurialis annua]
MSKAYLHRIGSLVKSIPRFSIQRFNYFSSQLAVNPKLPNFFTDEDESEDGKGGKGSAVYRQILRRQRPTTMRCKPELYNNVSFIGRVDRPLLIYNTKDDRFGGFTYFKVENPSNPNRMIRMLMEMWDDMAKIGVQHLKQNDYIYVSGRLGCFEKGNENGQLTLIYKVIVEEFCYVAELKQRPIFKKAEELPSEASKYIDESKSGDESGMELGRYESHLLLWQLFFCKPSEWWDRRKRKQNSDSPDFMHKYNGEKLWLRPDDPPWVRRQLQSLDIEIAKQRQANGASETDTKLYKNRYHLWQVLFSNPHEWWDARKNKKHSRLPDFKHKDTGEALWIHPDDPAWVKRQLQILDSAMAEQYIGKYVDSESQLSKWVFDG